MLGDFNARIGADQSSWPVCLGQFGIGKMNENGQRLLEVCFHYSLCVRQDLSTGISLTWSSPDAPPFHASRSHAVIRVLIAIQTIPWCAANESRENVSHKKGQKASYYEYGKVEEFARALEEYFQACPMLRHAIDKNAVHSAALSIFGRKTNKTADWFKSRS